MVKKKVFVTKISLFQVLRPDERKLRKVKFIVCIPRGVA